MYFQNHSCLLPQRTSDTRNLEERWIVGRTRSREEEGWGGGRRWQERDDENQIQQKNKLNK